VRALFVALLILIIGTAAVPGSAATAASQKIDDPPKRETLLNGMRLLTIERGGGRAAVVLAIRSGAMFDPAGKSGLANITAGLLLRGAGSYDALRIQQELDAANAKISVTTDWDATWISADGPVASVPVMIELMSAMVSAPRFADADVAEVRAAALQRVKADGGELAARADRNFALSLYGSHTYGRTIWGDEASIASVTPGDVKVFYDRFYAANAAVLAVCGVSASEPVVALARNQFGRWQKNTVVPATILPPTAATRTTLHVVDAPTNGRVVVRAGFMTPGRSDKNAATVTVLAERLERSLAAKIDGAADLSVHHDLRTLQSPFVVSYSVPVANVEGSLRTVVDAITSLKSAVTPPASASARIYFTKMSTSCNEEARTVAATEFFNAQSLAPDPVNYRVDEQQVSRSAKSVLRPEAMTVVLVGDVAELERLLKGKYEIEVAPAK
jgi:predicted Zn-dependent peptidase